MGKYAVFLFFFVYGCYVHKKPKPIPEEPVTWGISFLEVELNSYKYGNGQVWVKTHPSEPYYYPNSDSVLIEFLYFPHEKKLNYSRNVGGHVDSVFLGPLKFKAKDEFILSTELIAPGYRLTIHSPPNTKSYDRHYVHVLFGNFLGTPVREDFLHDNGTNYQSKLKDNRGEDSVCLSWYPDGRLQARKDQNRMDYYFQDGSYLSISDTSLKGKYYLTSAQYYYANGRMERQEFYYNNTPVHNWTYYSENGKLLKTLKKNNLAFVDTEVFIETSGEIPEIDPTLYYVEVGEKIIGDKLYQSLPKFLDSSWNYAIPGSYQLLVKISYAENNEIVEGLHYPSDDQEYRNWIDEQIYTVISGAHIRIDRHLERQMVEATFKISFKIAPKPKRTQPQN